jgi:hypothetical protein
MRSSRLKITGIVISLLAGVVWVFWPDVDGNAKKKPLNPQFQRVNEKAQPDGEFVREKLLIPDAEGVEKPEGMPDADWQRLLRIHAIKKSANRDLSFYGKVVDQYGNPVEGVQLEIEILSYQDSFIDYVKTGREQIKEELNLKTDAKGMFSVERKIGTSFSIERMTKEGYIASDRGVQYTFVYNNLSSGPDSTMYHSADKLQPVVYELWKKGETEPLIVTFAKLTLEPEKGINEVYYRMTPKGKPSPHPMPGWDIKVTGKSIHSPNPKRQQDDYWEVTLTAGEGGGLVLTDSPHANLAPESGYQKNLVIKSTEQENPWDRPVRRAYYRRKDGEEFAAFRLDIDIGSQKTGSRIYVTLADLRINPNGSRNLEFDPTKEIK